MKPDRGRRYLRFLGARPEADVEDEIAFHLEMRERELVERGMAPAEARHEAQRRFGDRARVEAQMRHLERQRTRGEARRAGWQTLGSDVAFVVRTLVRQPVFALSVILTLGLSIGANASIFSAVNTFLLKPLAVRSPERLTVVAAAEKSNGMINSVAYPTYREVRQLPVIEDAVAWMGVEAALRTDGEPLRGFILAASDNYFTALGVQAALGRVFTPAEAAARTPVIAITDTYWERAFGRDPGVVGRTIRINETPFTIVGVLPRSFRGTQPLVAIDAVIPVESTVAFDPPMQRNLESMGWTAFRILAYTKPGVTMSAARTALGQLGDDLRRRFPAEFADYRLVMEREIRTRPEYAVSRFTPWIAGVFYGMVVLALLVACANVANLLLVRATVRRGEIAIRSALGASPGRVVRLLLTESVLLGAASLAVAYVLARFCIGWLTALPVAIDVPVNFGLELDGRVFAYTAAISLLAGVLSGLAPALLGARSQVAEVLRDGGRGGSAGPGRARMRSALVVAQVAVSFILLVCGGLFIRSARNASRIDLGFTRERVLLAQVDLSLHRIDEKESRQLQDRFIETVGALPGVERVALGTFLPMSGNFNYTPLALSLDDQSPQAPNGYFGSAIASVTPGYITVLGMKLLAGRDFTPQDDSLAPGALIVNQALVDALWPGKDAIGRKLRIDKDGPWVEVVGVVATSTVVLLGESPRAMVFRPLRQSPSRQTSFLIKSRGPDPAAIIPDVRRAIASVDPRILLYGTRTMANHLDQGIALFFVNMGATLATAIGILGLLQTIVGLYGVLSYSVAQRNKEFGIRMALGARAALVLRDVLWQSARLVVVGLGIGGIVALIVTRMMGNVLVGVSPTDALAYGGALVVVTVLALASSYLPAWRASQVAPAVVVRGD
ncbi:MAG: ABC transporter permease [Gemmatimonadaceae bacterium]|nr:ABC transporter permease [Gemmatimonadaceae bacterium]